MPYRKKPKALKKKRIMRKTGARSQAKQISALSTQVNRLVKSQYESGSLVWIRSKLPIDSAAGGIQAYVCPVPITPGNPFYQDVYGAAVGSGARVRWADSLALGNSSTSFMEKFPLFGFSEAARNSPEWNHVGGTLKYRIESDEPSFSTYSLFLIQAKSRQSDQLISDRLLKNSRGTYYPGSAGKLSELDDFCTHPQLMGTDINTKYWKILARRAINFGHPGSTQIAGTTNPANTNPRNNSIVVEGTIRLPAGGVIRSTAKALTTTGGVGGTINPSPLNASQVGFLDEDNSKTCYLVVINNGVSTDLESVSMTVITKDHYKIAV